jgi:hypothetical protein
MVIVVSFARLVTIRAVARARATTARVASGVPQRTTEKLIAQEPTRHNDARRGGGVGRACVRARHTHTHLQTHATRAWTSLSRRNRRECSHNDSDRSLVIAPRIRARIRT